MGKKNKRLSKNKIKQKNLKKHTYNKTKRKKNREKESEGYPPNSPYFSESFFTCSLPVSSLKSLEHKQFV